MKHDGLYDTGDHRLSGFSQQQSGDQSLTFTSQFGLVRVADLPVVAPKDERAHEPPPTVSVAPPRMTEAAPPAPAAVPTAAAAFAGDDILKTIERLAELRQKNILTEEEFAAKKADLLSRL